MLVGLRILCLFFLVGFFGGYKGNRVTEGSQKKIGVPSNVRQHAFFLSRSQHFVVAVAVAVAAVSYTHLTLPTILLV